MALSVFRPPDLSQATDSLELFLLYETTDVDAIAWRGRTGLLTFGESSLQSASSSTQLKESSRPENLNITHETGGRSLHNRLPEEIEAIIRLLATSSSLRVPRLSELWQSRMQLSTALAGGPRRPFKHDTDSRALSPFELASVVTLQSGAGISQEGTERLALALDIELEQQDNLQEIAEQYGKAVSQLESSQEINPAYLVVFQHDGKVFGLTGSLLGYERAFKIIHGSTEVDRENVEPLHLEALANICVKKYEKWHGRTDLDQAIKYCRNCLKETEETDSRYIARVISLSYVLQIRGVMYQSTTDIIEARRLLKRNGKFVVNANAYDQAKYRSVQVLVNFASWTVDKDSVSYPDVIEEFLQVSKDTSIDSKFLVNAAHYMRLALLQPAPADRKDLYEARLSILHDLARVFMRVLSIMSSDNPTRITFWKLAADLHLWLYNETRRSEYGEEASRLYDNLCSDPMADPETRIHAACFSASFHITLNGDIDAAYNVMTEAYFLMPEVVSEGLTRQDQLQVLRKLWHIPSFAASVALEADATAEKALRLLEQGRGVLWDNLLDQKVPITRLYQRNANLADHYVELRSRIQGSREVVLRTKDIDLDPRHHAFRLQELLTKIRAQDGFYDFLKLPSDIEGLERLGSEGPVVAVNISMFRSDALIMTKTGIVSQRLPELDLKTCNEKMSEFREAAAQIKVDQSKAASMLAPILKWLWEAIAEPVLTALLIFPTTSELPHIWWLTTGPMNVLPIHAAGDHERAKSTGEACTLLDQAICSYTPTLRALEFARKKQHSGSLNTDKKNDVNILLVPMPKTPNMADLNHAEQEADKVESIFTTNDLQDRVRIKRLRRPRCTEVLEALRSNTIAHFACHAKVNDKDPSKSHLRLQDWGSSPLDVSTLMELDLSQCQLAYLSACETAVNKDAELQDEGIHISGGFQMAGVSNTIATWWEIEDRYPVFIATAFYKTLIENGYVDFSKCAASLRTSTLALRARGVGPLIWGAYVHYGS
ncbi:hypothetical protein MMC30_003622 [Trapelia coarctata]|nr:hypothetical protein [Trapelia coarctata]